MSLTLLHSHTRHERSVFVLPEEQEGRQQEAVTVTVLVLLVVVLGQLWHLTLFSTVSP